MFLYKCENVVTFFFYQINLTIFPFFYNRYNKIEKKKG